METKTTGCVQETVTLTHTRGGNGVCDLLDTRALWAAVAPLVTRSGASAGFLHLCVAATRGVALSLNENCDPTVRSDLAHALEHLLPDSEDDDKDKNKEDDAAVLARAALVGPAIALPFERRGGVLTGTWQGVYLCDLRARAQRTPTVAAVATVVPAASAPARFNIAPPGRGCHVIASQLARATATATATATALTAVLVRHTSAALALGSDAGKAAREAVEALLSAAVPERWNREFFCHTYEGPDDMPAHAKSTIVGASLVLPAPTAAAAASCGVPLLCEHRDAGGWGGGGRTCVVVTSAPCAVQHIIAIPCSGNGDRDGAEGICAVGDRIREAVLEGRKKDEEEEGELPALVNVVCSGGAGTVALVVAPRGEGVRAALAQVRAALVRPAVTGAEAAAAAATVLGRAVTLPWPVSASTHDVYAVCTAEGAFPGCKLVVTAL